MITLAKRLASIKSSPTLALTQKANELKRSGKDIINLALGEPDFSPPAWVSEAAIKAIHAQHTKYTAVGGTPELKQAISNKFARDNNLTYLPNQVIASTGCKQVLFNALLATVDPGDEVIVPSPCWVSYLDMVLVAEGKPVVLNCPQAQGFKLIPQQLEAAITAKTKWVILNSPSNPTGAMYSYEELWQLAQVLLRHPHVMVLTDDIYEHIVFDNRTFNTIADVEPQLKDRTLTVNGVSKAYSMTGWRIGFAGGPESLIKAMIDLQSHSTSNPCSIAQEAATAALDGPFDFNIEWRQAFSERAHLVVERLNQIPGIQCLMPDGAFYVFPSCIGLLGKKTKQGDRISADSDLCAYLLDHSGVTVVPGSAFEAPGHFRLSFAVDKTVLEKAIERLKKAIEDLIS
jgi:aspartate aminotransferase